MDKEWCTYSWQCKTLPEGVGKITAEYNSAVDIRYSEGQYYSPECWDINYVQRFDTLEEAMEYFLKHKPSYDYRMDHKISEELYWERIKESFPSYFKEKDKE